MYNLCPHCKTKFNFKTRSKSTVHRFHLYLSEHGIYQEIFNELLNKGYDLNKIDLSHVE
jgi:putative transposase